MTALKAAASHADYDVIDDICEPAAMPSRIERKNAGGARAPEAKGDGVEALTIETARLATATADSVKGLEEKFGKLVDALHKSVDDEDKRKKTKGAADPVDVERTDRINKGIDEVEDLKKRLRVAEIKAGRPGIGGRKASPEMQRAEMQTEWRKAADVYMRTGDEGPLRRFQAKAMAASTNAGADGGLAVFAEQEQSILDKLLVEVSPFRQLADIKSISTSQYTKLIGLGGATSGWVGETDARPATNTPTLAQLSYFAQTLYANPAASSDLLDDNAADLESWLADEVVEEFAKQEGASFVKGNGTNKPKGLLDYTKVANSAWAHGNIGYIASGDAATLGATPLDKLVDLTFAIKAGHRNGSRFLMNRNTLGTLRKVKDSTGNFIWTSSAEAGVSGQLLGYPVTEDEEMPAIGANAFPIAFGNFKRGYLIVDRRGVNVLRNPYSNPPYINFYTTKRVGGGMQNFEVVKLVKCATA